jgi:Cytochrome P460
LKPILLLTLAAFSLVLPLHLQAYEHYSEKTADPFEGLSTFNNMTLKQFGDFTKWELVTVRFRRDSGELRFTYANSIAAQSLKEGKTKYEDGAIFAKIAVKTTEDPDFTSSAIPSGAARFQFMVKDQKKYKSTDGWGYALFDRDGKTFPGEPNAAVVACLACHRLVPSRDYVFSQPANLSKLVLSSSIAAIEPRGKVEPGLQWKRMSRKELPPTIRELLPDGESMVDSVVGEIQKNIFLGTLDEIRPALIQSVMTQNRPAVLYSEDGSRYSLVYKSLLKGPECSDSKTRLVHVGKTSVEQTKPVTKIVCQ